MPPYVRKYTQFCDEMPPFRSFESLMVMVDHKVRKIRVYMTVIDLHSENTPFFLFSTGDFLKFTPFFKKSTGFSPVDELFKTPPFP